MPELRTVMDQAAITRALDVMVEGLTKTGTDAPWAIVGIRRGGEHLARRLTKRMAQRLGHEPPLGFVDITLYRDDGFGPHDWPQVGVSQVGFDIPRHTVVLVDDVLYTGRTVRAAIDAILDYGRPKAIRLAVLVDRGLRELPIAADVAGQTLATKPDEHVVVALTEAGAAADAVTVEPGPQKPPKPQRLPGEVTR
jgi:pyrimidine operon attenuation protein / uracil phosphoribosyltransferase